MRAKIYLFLNTCKLYSALSRKLNQMIRAILFSFCFSIRLTSAVAMGIENDSLTLDALDARSGVYYTLTALGGHKEYCLSLSLKNTTNDSIGIYIEPGRVFLADNSKFQDLVVMRSLYVKVPSGKEVKKSIYAFCCRATRASPPKGLAFRNGYYATGLMGKLADFVSKRSFNGSDIQNSVWIISEGSSSLNHPIASICDYNGTISPLKKWFADQLNKPYPWHCIEYDRTDSSVWQSKHLRVTGNFSFTVSRYATLTIQIRTQDGQLVGYLQQNAVYNSGNFDYPLDLDVKGWPKGVYEILVFEDGNRINKPTFFDL